MRVGLGFIAALAVLVFITWTSDFVTLQGERTIYTVGCADGSWQGSHCTGRLVPAERYRYRALRARHEVLFWTVGVTEPSSKFTDCVIQDGRNWSCKPNADAPKSVTLEIVRGEAAHDETGQVRNFHAVPKWRWMLANYGVSTGSDAEL